MSNRKPEHLLMLIAALVIVAAVLHVTAQECDKTNCKGPIRYYEDLKCKPVYDKPGDCCATRYDCSHLRERSTGKCYANGKEYAIGEQLKDEDRTDPCQVACVCTKGKRDVRAEFRCSAVACNVIPTRRGCFFKKQEDSCCGVEICPKKGVDVFECESEGEWYDVGEIFYPSGYPKMRCQCLRGYKGENVKPFCSEIPCVNHLYNDLGPDCAPIYRSHQPPATSCSHSTRCQNKNDKVARYTYESSPDKIDDAKNVSDNAKCIFGNLTLQIGEHLSQATDYYSTCVKCTCEVPPVLTCILRPSVNCDPRVSRKSKISPEYY